MLNFDTGLPIALQFCAGLTGLVVGGYRLWKWSTEDSEVDSGPPVLERVLRKFNIF